MKSVLSATLLEYLVPIATKLISNIMIYILGTT